MKKALMIIVLIVSCVSTLCFAEEAVLHPFLDCNGEEAKVQKDIANEMNNEIYLPLSELADKLQSANKYKDASDCLFVANTIYKLSMDFLPTQQ